MRNAPATSVVRHPRLARLESNSSLDPERVEYRAISQSDFSKTSHSAIDSTVTHHRWGAASNVVDRDQDRTRPTYTGLYHYKKYLIAIVCSVHCGFGFAANRKISGIAATCVCVCVRACVRTSERACVRACLLPFPLFVQNVRFPVSSGS